MEGPMTPYADLVARLRDGLNLLRARVDNNETHLWTCNGDDDGSPCDCGAICQRDLVDQLLDALAALPPLDDPSDRNTAAEHYRQGWQAGHAAADPPALVVASVLMRTARDGNDDQKSIERLNAWRGEILAVMDALSTPPPADLVALVREWQEAMRGYSQGVVVEDHDFRRDTVNRLDEAERQLLAAPLGAPPAPGWPDGNNAVQWKPKPDCVIGVYCQRHGFIHGQEAKELREHLEALSLPAVNRVLDEVDARDSLAYLEATNEPTPPDVPLPPAPDRSDR